MKRICIVFSIIVAVLVLFAATSVRAACNTQIAGYCFELNGFQVEAVDLQGNPISAGGNFPVIDSDGNSVFGYKITNNTNPPKSIRQVDILIPVCTPGLDLANRVTTPSSDLYLSGAGDPNTGFGIGQTDSDVLGWNFSGKSGIVSLKLAGKVPAIPNAMLVLAGESPYPYGSILVPACGAISQVASPSVPLSKSKVVNFSGIGICLESSDESGCPTSIYSCCTGGTPTNCTAYANADNSVCNCPEDYKQFFTEDNLEIIPPHLAQVSTISDPRCPLTLLSLESIPCTQTIIVNGKPVRKTYSTSPPCTK